MNDHSGISLSSRAGVRALVLAGALWFTGCATTPPLTSADIELAEQSGQLGLMFDQLQGELARTRKGSDKALYLTQLRDEVGLRLAAPRLQRVDELLGRSGQALLSLAELDELDEAVSALRQWRPYDRPELESEAAAVRRRTVDELARLEAELESLGEGAGSRYGLLKRMAALDSGELTQARHQQAADTLNGLYEAGLSALQRKQLPVAKELFGQVAAADPAYRDVVYYRELVDTGLFEQRFWQALVEGSPEEAYRVFHEFAQTPAYATHSNRVAQDALELADYYDAVGEKWRRQRNWVESYRAFERASFIRDKIGDDAPPSAEQRVFIDEMERRYQVADRGGRQSEALAYLSVIEQLDPGNALPAGNKELVYGEVLQQALVHFDISGFAGEHGEAVSAAVRQRLAGAGAAIALAPLQAAAGPARLQYAVIGEVVSAEVVSSSMPRMEQRKVAVGTVAGPNPDYEQWRLLPPAERAQTPAPPATQDVQRYALAEVPVEDTVVEATITVRFSVQPGAGEQAVLQDQVSERKAAEGVAVGAFQIGDHYYEAVAAPLPTQAELLRQLVDAAADGIADRLLRYSAAAPAQYVAQAERLSAADRRAAVSQWSYAYVISDPRSGDREKMRRAMEEAVLRL